MCFKVDARSDTRLKKRTLKAKDSNNKVNPVMSTLSALKPKHLVNTFVWI